IVQSGESRPIMLLSLASILPSLFMSAYFKSPGSLLYTAASSASSVFQVPSRVRPQNDPTGSPTLKIFINPWACLVVNISSSLVPSFRTLFLLVVNANLVDHVNLSEIILKDSNDTSNP